MGIGKAHARIPSTVEVILLVFALLVLASSVALADVPGTPLANQGKTLLAVEDDQDLTPQNGVPLVIVRVNESDENGSIDAMNSSADHSVKCTSATVEVLIPEGYTGGYAPAGTASEPAEPMELNYVRGRGNSTWKSNKRRQRWQRQGQQQRWWHQQQQQYQR